MFFILDSDDDSNEGRENWNMEEYRDHENSAESDENAGEENDADFDESSDDMGLFESSNDSSLSDSEEDDSSDSSEGDSSTSNDDSALYDSNDTDSSNNSDSNSESSSGSSIYENDENLDEPLYDRAPITVADSIIAVIYLTFRHKLSNICLANILSLISLACLRPNNCINSLYKFNKILQDLWLRKNFLLRRL